MVATAGVATRHECRVPVRSLGAAGVGAAGDLASEITRISHRISVSSAIKLWPVRKPARAKRVFRVLSRTDAADGRGLAELGPSVARRRVPAGVFLRRVRSTYIISLYLYLYYLDNHLYRIVGDTREKKTTHVSCRRYRTYRTSMLQVQPRTLLELRRVSSERQSSKAR